MRAAVERLHLHINEGNSRRGITFGDLAQHYAEHELVDHTESIHETPHTTVRSYERIIRNRLLPRWGNRIAPGIEPLEVEQWLRNLQRKIVIMRLDADLLRWFRANSHQSIDEHFCES